MPAGECGDAIGLWSLALRHNTQGFAQYIGNNRFHIHEPFVRVMPLSDPDSLKSGFFDVQGCNDTNRVDVFVFAHESQALLMARLDNLGKGASGAAVQCMNIHLGCAEDAGLSPQVNHKVV